MERDIREILGDEVEIVVTPFVFETGNIFFVEAADGETVLVTGKKTAFDNEEYRVRPWAEMLRARGLDELMRETFGVDSVIVLGSAPSRPPGPLYFEYHLDMGMVVLRDRQAVVARLVSPRRARQEAMAAIDSGDSDVAALVAAGVEERQLRATLPARLETVTADYEEYAAVLSELGLEVHRSDVTWRHVVSSMSWTNVLQVGDRVIMPLYPDASRAKKTGVTRSGGRMRFTLDVSAVGDERFALEGENLANYNLYRRLGYDVQAVPEYLHYFMGGVHCFANILE
jgi:hypothetical protein